MKNTLLILSLCCVFFACKNDKKNPDKLKVPSADKVTETTKSEPEEVKDILVVPAEIESYLEKSMPGYSIVPREKWLADDYIANFPKSRRPLYMNDILVESDFNGDGEDDFATFLEDKNGNMSLYAFHKTNNGYKKYLITKLGKNPLLGAGLEVEEPGFIYGGNKEVGLEYSGINYNVYEKTTKTYYYDAGRYRSVLTGD